jgi:hypothetical protein
MIQENTKPPPIPFPSIEVGDKAYYISEIVNWIFKYDIRANYQDIDLVRIYDWLDPISFRTQQKDPINQIEFKPVMDSDPDMNKVKHTDSIRAFNHTDISCHSKIVFSLIELLVNNFQDFISEVTKYLQIQNIHTQEGHRGELGICDILITKLQNLLSDGKSQLIPSLFCHQQDTKLSHIDNYIPPLGISLDEPRYMLYTYGYIFSKRTSDIFTQKFIKLTGDRQILLKKIYDTKLKKTNATFEDLSIHEVVTPDYIEEFNQIEELLIRNKRILKRDDEGLVWLKSILEIIAFIYTLDKRGYLRRRILEKKKRVSCRKFFEKRYGISIGQNFEIGKIENNIGSINRYMDEPIYKDIKPMF